MSCAGIARSWLECKSKGRESAIAAICFLTQEDEVDVGGRPVCLVGLHAVFDTLKAAVHDTRFMLLANTHAQGYDCADFHHSLGDCMQNTALGPLPCA